MQDWIHASPLPSPPLPSPPLPPLSCSTVLGCVQHLANPLLLLHLLIVGWMVCTIWNTTLHLFTLFQTQVSHV